MPVLARSEWLTGLTLGALGLVIAWLLLRTHRYLARQKGDASPLVHVDRPPRADRGPDRDAPAEVLRWEVQMHETARQLSAQLDSKMGVLQALIAEADRAAARLEAAAPNAPGPIRQPPPPDTQATTQAEALRAAGPSDRPAEQAGAPADRPSPKHRREEIYTLADYGLAPGEIARRVRSPVGEVELILGLRGKH